MQRSTIRLEGRLTLARVLFLALLTPATVVAADPTPSPSASN